MVVNRQEVRAKSTLPSLHIIPCRCGTGSTAAAPGTRNMGSILKRGSRPYRSCSFCSRTMKRQLRILIALPGDSVPRSYSCSTQFCSPLSSPWSFLQNDSICLMRFWRTTSLAHAKRPRSRARIHSEGTWSPAFGEQRLSTCNTAARVRCRTQYPEQPRCS
jgi:hypothetical protein